jgi:hypothetical protein
MVVAMNSTIRMHSGTEKDSAADQVGSLRVDQSAEQTEPALPKLASAWARLQAHVAGTFQSSVSTCSSSVSRKTQVAVEKLDRSVIVCSHGVSDVANDGRQYVVSNVDLTKSQINATHETVKRTVDETTEAGMARLATARAETMRKVEETQSSITETYGRAKESTTVMCMASSNAEAQADAEVELTPEQVEQLKEAFAVFDKSGDGKVTAEELGRVMEECGESVTKDEIDEMMKDVSVEGTINFDEFKAIMARLAAEEAGLPLSKRIAKVPLKMQAQWRAGVRHAQGSVERAQAETARKAAEKVKEAEESVTTAVEKTKQAAIEAKQSTVGWLDSALASVIESFVPPPPPKAPVVPTLGNVGDMDDTENAYTY